MNQLESLNEDWSMTIKMKQRIWTLLPPATDKAPKSQDNKDIITFYNENQENWNVNTTLNYTGW